MITIVITLGKDFNNMNKEQRRQHNFSILENIYDLLRLNHLTEKDQDDWSDLTRKFGKEASKQLKRFTRNKEMEIDLDNGILRIGKYFKAQIIN